MPITPIITTSKLNEQTGLVLAYYGYDQSKVPPAELKAVLDKGWISIDDASNPKKLVAKLDVGYNIQTNSSGTVENSFSVYFNEKTKQIGFSIKGSDASSNWVSDLTNAGASEFAKIQAKAQAAIDVLKKDYPDFQIIVVGHSLAGGMAQALGVKNGLDVQVVNPLPIARGIIDSGYFGSKGYDASVAEWRAAGHQVQDIRTPNDIATWFYNNDAWGSYLSDKAGQSVTLLPGTQMPDFLKFVTMVSGYGTPLGLVAFGTDHTMGSAIDSVVALSVDPATGRYIIPEGHANILSIPVALRAEFSKLNIDSPIVGVSNESNSDTRMTFWITRQDGTKQWVSVDKTSGDTLVQQSDGQGGYLELSMNTQNGKDTVALKHLNSSNQVTSDAQMEAIAVEGSGLSSYGWKTDAESGSSTWADGVRTDAVTPEGGADTKITVTDTETGQSKTLTAGGTSNTSPTPEQLAQTQTNALYTDMAGFITALRNKDKLNQALYGAKIIIDTQIKDGVSPSLEGMQTALGGLSATVGVVAGLHALQSDDTRTQISGAVGLLSSANQLAAYSGVTNGVGADKLNGFLDKGTLGMLNTMGALISLANLKNLDTMLENGQVGSAAASVYAAWQAGTALSAAATATESGFFASMGAAGSFDPTTALAMVVGAMVLDDILGGGSSYTPPPPPPVGWAEFTKNAQGQLTWLYHGSTPEGKDMPGDKTLGQTILQTKMTEILAELNKEVAEANQGNTDPDRALVLIASRIPKVYLQSWPSYTGNGETNYYYMLEQTHPQNGQKIYSGVARQDIAKFFSGSLVMPEAIAHTEGWRNTDAANVDCFRQAA